MATQEMEVKLALIRKLKDEKAELEDQIAALEDSVKAEMDSKGVSSMTIGTYSVKYTRFFRNYFDKDAFKTKHEDLYDEYTRPVPASRFTVSEK